MKSSLKFAIFGAFLALLPSVIFASQNALLNLRLTNHYVGYLCLGIFFIAYIFVISEEFIQLRKSKPVIVASGILWIIVAIAANYSGMQASLNATLDDNLLEYVKLFLFLIVAMTYINALTERNVFAVLSNFLMKLNMTYRQQFWALGCIGFVLSPFAGIIPTALVLGAVAISLAHGNKRFLSLMCINIVVAVNAGGAFSPFGDITTLMVWQKKSPTVFYIFQNIFAFTR